MEKQEVHLGIALNFCTPFFDKIACIQTVQTQVRLLFKVQFDQCQQSFFPIMFGEMNFVQKGDKKVCSKF